MAGYTWLFLNFLGSTHNHHGDYSVCLIKNVSGVPCPSCGSTRAVVALIKGDIIQSIMLNPLGLVIFLIMLIIPMWIIFDLSYKRDSFYLFYRKAERKLQERKYMISFFVLIILNWIWNVVKGL